MMLLAFVDIHGDMASIRKLKKKAAGADILLCAGDLTVFETHLRVLLQELNSLGKPVLIIPGNHESDGRLKSECSRHKNLFFLHREFYEKEGVLFVGYGGGGFSLKDEKFERFAEKIDAKRLGKQLVAMFHGPPYGNKTDLIMGEHAGNKSYRDFIKEQKPLLVVCGHLHENAGVQDKIGRTLVVNPGPEGKLIEI